MSKSARILGQDYGLTAQEMNYVLKEKGYLQGDPGDYGVTDKGRSFASEQDFHRGTGGYSQYNRYWTTRSWDDSIADELNVTDDDKHEARAAIAEARRQQREEMKAARAEADARFLSSQESGDSEDSSYDNSYYDSSSEDDSDAANAALVIFGLIALGYGIYKATPKVINWWKTKVAPNIKKKKLTAGKGAVAKEMPCPACGGTMALDEKEGQWNCKACDYTVSDDAIRNGEVFWFCDKCEAFMNTQPGFNTDEGHWVCAECGFDNDVTPADVDED